MLTDGHASHKGLNRTLRPRVHGMFRYTLCLASNAAHEDDASAHLHAVVRLLGNEELPAGVDVHHTVILLLVNILEVAERDNARVRAADVELSEMGDGLFHEASSLLGVRDIGFDSNGVRTVLQGLDLLNYGFGGFTAVGVVHDDFSTTAGQLHGHFLANATACNLVSGVRSHLISPGAYLIQ